MIVPKNCDISEVGAKIALAEPLFIREGENEIGTATYSYAGHEIGETALLLESDVNLDVDAIRRAKEEVADGENDGEGGEDGGSSEKESEKRGFFDNLKFDFDGEGVTKAIGGIGIGVVSGAGVAVAFVEENRIASIIACAVAIALIGLLIYYFRVVRPLNKKKQKYLLHKSLRKGDGLTRNRFKF